MANFYSSKDVQRIFGISADKLSYLIRRKNLIEPDVVGKGRGKLHYFSKENLFYMSLILTLEKYGVGWDVIKEVIEGSNPIKNLNMNWSKPARKRREEIYEIYRRTILKDYRNYKKDYQRIPMMLIICRVGSRYYQFFGPHYLILDRIKRGFEGKIRNLELDEVLSIDVTKIIKKLEQKIGNEL